MVGATVAGRERSDLEDAVGLFANTVALALEPEDGPTFHELLGRVRTVVHGAMAHQDVPFERLVAELQLERDLSRHPIFQVFFAHVPQAPLDIPGAEPFDARPSTARFDLTLWVEEEANDELELVWEYATDLFDGETIARFEAYFLELLQAAIDAPAQTVADLPIIAPAERDNLVEASASKAEFPVACLHELFAAQVERSPDAPALTFEGTTISYGELDARANAVAHRLRAEGVGPDVLVALCLERSLEQVIAILGVLKAGGAYVPLDPQYPAERLAYILEDTQAPVLLTQESLLEGLPRTRRLHCASAPISTRGSAGPSHRLRNRVPRISPTSSTPQARRAHPRESKSSTETLPGSFRQPTRGSDSPRLTRGSCSTRTPLIFPCGSSGDRSCTAVVSSFALTGPRARRSNSPSCS